MKTPFFRSTLCAAAACCLLLSRISAAETNSVSTIQTTVNPLGVQTERFYYEVKFSGGNIDDFFRFWRTNGFLNDSVLLAGNVNDIDIPSFKIKEARLSEIAKSLEFVTQDRLSVEVLERSGPSHGNIWRVKVAAPIAAKTLKSRACSVPHLLNGQPNAVERINMIAHEVQRSLLDEVERIYRDSNMFPRGSVTILDSEKIVVVVGNEAYVEAVAGALEAAEKVQAPPLQYAPSR